MKLLNIIVCILFSLVLAGCKRTTTSNESNASAPTSISGKTVKFTVSSGAGDFASSGTWILVVSSTVNNYEVLGDNVNVFNSAGTFVYSADGNKATVAMVDSLIGAGNFYLTFTSATAGTYTADAEPSSSASQSGSFTASGTTTVTQIKLPDTGQTQSYTSTFGGDHDYLINAPSFTNNGDDTVNDGNTGLIWQRQDDGISRTWVSAVTYCADLSLGGQTDWRLPEAYELQTIVDYGKHSPAIDTTYFPSTQSSYWSTTFVKSTSSVYYKSSAWIVHFSLGSVGSITKTRSYYVRCVRGG